ncbi:AcrR family transcriptional regulator [Kineococcus xinjiangensis]|uniref:AcrR family transcriptional regulator n=1 Tax=Kineococcus xinjiangensis TaxID=512762 RepID=A0A2S6IK66_9ACTN|nr:TetR/AcrR family transcriptional regulator [Kineococcus xinjiangensis]PPK94624.1 AcrR family transcriptional regulator [Kineococcus xinjiangensis]
MAGPSEHLLDALVAIVADRGLEGVSIRQVADRAGVSIGAVQHHFPTKNALLLAAMEHVSTRFRAELQQRLSAAPSPGGALRILALLLAGADGAPRASTVVWLSFAAHAAVDEQVAEVHRREWASLERFLADLVAAGAPHRTDPAGDAAALLALLDGLAVAVALEPQRMPPARAERLVDAWLAGLDAG